MSSNDWPSVLRASTENARLAELERRRTRQERDRQMAEDASSNRLPASPRGDRLPGGRIVRGTTREH